MKISEIISDNCDLLANVVESEEKQEPCDDYISRQAVLYILKDKWNMFSDANDAMQESIDTIESLRPFSSSENPNKCEDAINRQAVLEYIEGSEAELGHSSENELVCQYIKELPPVTPQLKTGQWIERIERDDWDDSEEVWYECNQCHLDSERVSNYCPNCGAKMSEGSDKE